MKSISSIFCAALLLAACNQTPPAPTPAQALALKPAGARLAQLYEHSCKACHAVPGTGAPLVHDHAAWDPRWDKGMPILREHAILGFQAMPAGGQCAACSAKDFEDLIRFLADQKS